MLDRSPIGDHLDVTRERLGPDAELRVGADRDVARPLTLAIGSREIDDLTLDHEPDRDLVGLTAPPPVVRQAQRRDVRYLRETVDKCRNHGAALSLLNAALKLLAMRSVAILRLTPRAVCTRESSRMFGRVLWLAVVLAFLADLVVDWAFGNTVVNLATFAVVFTVVALVRYSQRTD